MIAHRTWACVSGEHNCACNLFSILHHRAASTLSNTFKFVFGYAMLSHPLRKILPVSFDEAKTLVSCNMCKPTHLFALINFVTRIRFSFIADSWQEAAGEFGWCKSIDDSVALFVML
jgi:hypothetical protein